MIDKKLKDMTYNDYAALSLGEAQALKRIVDTQMEVLVDLCYDLAKELPEEEV